MRKILTFSRQTGVELAALNLNEELSRAATLLGRTIDKMINIEIKMQPDLRMVMADPTQIEQIILNLASNAQEAMPDGGHLIFSTNNVDLDDVFCAQHPGLQSGPYVLLTISDTGFGMDEQTQAHIFEPFFTTKEVGKGTGLGLSTAYGIIKNYFGYIACYSEQGTGTTFKIFLPSLIEKVPSPSLPDEQPEDIAGGSETILLVDDEEPLLTLGSNALEAKGYKVIRAESGEKALKIYHAEKDSIGLIISDLGMPGMGGRKFIREVLTLTPNAKVIVASGYGDSGLVQTVMQEGAIGFVAKPFRKVELQKAVRIALDKN